MADKLLLYYKYVGEQHGLSGKIQLAQITKIPSVKAAFAPDDAPTINAFKSAVAQITGKPAPDY